MYNSIFKKSKMCEHFIKSVHLRFDVLGLLSKMSRNIRKTGYFWFQEKPFRKGPGLLVAGG